MKQDNRFSGQTRVFWTCMAPLEGRAIYHLTEIHEVRGCRLGAIVHRLKTEFGWPVEVEYREPENVAYYRLRPGTDSASLNFPRSARALAVTEES